MVDVVVVYYLKFLIENINNCKFVFTFRILSGLRNQYFLHEINKGIIVIIKYKSRENDEIFISYCYLLNNNELRTIGPNINIATFDAYI